MKERDHGSDHVSGSAATTRRTVLVTGAAAVVAGCTRYGEKSGGESFAPASPPSPPTARTPGSAPPPAGEPLGTTGEVPEGGGKVFAAQKVVVTQPVQGDFKAFSAICTHQGCTVNEVANGTIDCPCHGSRFRITDGSVARGPAQRPLAPKRITVSGNEIRLV
ncbi:Rieske (2Fe-2S) protein [Streptomyces sp. NPDC059175]|uniref:Rieske (2Fe-2S) protein n=1 Tax=unclassified Streptomyces TaxID=2593676 RepID=UPI003685A9E9